MNELKPCPFCGGPGMITCDGEVYCRDCGAFPEPFNNDPIENWNTRHDPEEIPEWLKTWLTETITNCELLADELMDKSVGNGTNGDIEEAVRLKRRANTFREVLSLKKPEE